MLQPFLLLRLKNVCVLDTDVAAVGVAEQSQNVTQGLVVGAAEAVDLERPIQIPQRQSVVEDVEVGMAAEAVGIEAQRVDIGHQVATIPVVRDQFHHPGVLVDDRVRVVDGPAHRQVGVAEFAEDVVPEIVREQQQMDGPQEVPGFRALNDSVVVGRGQGDQLADAQCSDPLFAGSLELGRVFHGADADDRALAVHQPRHRVHGADSSRVRQRNRDPGEVLSGEFAVAGPTDDVFVGRHELGELHCFATLDGCYHQ